MKLNPSELKQIVDLTLEQYNRGADDFWEGTLDHNVSQNIVALLQYIYGEPPFTILDFGCGPGRDLKTFADLGHIAVGLDGASRFAAMARIHSGCEVRFFSAADLVLMLEAAQRQSRYRRAIHRA